MRTLFVLVFPALCLALPPTVLDPQPATKETATRLDHYGDLLPDGALLRIGTRRLRPGGAVEALAFTPDGKRLVTTSKTMGVHVWDVPTGKEFVALPLPEAQAIALAADGSLVARVETEDLCCIPGVRRRVELLLAKVDALPWRGDVLQLLRALEILELLGTTESVDLLESLAHGAADAWLTQEATASLEMVRKQLKQ